MSRFIRLLAVALTLTVAIAAPARAEPSHGLAMHGLPKYGPGFSHFAYTNPDAPKGGSVTYAAIGSFDSLNPWVVQGQAAAGVRALMYETLMKRAWDEPFTLYGLLAETVEVARDRSWIAFTLNGQARFSDGRPVTVEDVIFSLELIRTKGRPNSRTTFNKIVAVEETGPGAVRFSFADGSDRELPLLVAGFLPILSKAYWQDREFAATTLEPPVSSGPYLVDRVDPGRAVVYRRDPDYWGADLGVNRGQFNFDRITYDYYRDGDVALEAFKSGDYDFRYEFDAGRWATQYDFPAVAAGDVTIETVSHGMPSGLRGFAFNLRKPMFQDRLVRQAFVLAFDFERVNRVLLHSAFTRTGSMFDNSGLRPRGYPGNGELRLLARWWGEVPDEVFGPAWVPPATDGSGTDRTNLGAARELLRAAGWRVADGRLVDGSGAPFDFEILLVDPSDEGLALAYAEGLERLGIAVRVNLVESAQYQARLEDFDFDMAIRRWGVTLSPGNEQQNYWSSATARAAGSRNTAGVADPAVDALIDALVGARFRNELVTAARALDRVLMWNYYVVPLYYQPGFNMARWNRIEMPDIISTYGPVQESFWAKP
ncbi:MAG: extracellular solute-binding protein [Alphaproteobacteria bacterium]|nr:extracellular solute-binding protein [Alphaproteobacteria bacterium]